MSCTDTKSHYGCVTRWLHGLLSVLIVFQIVAGIFLDKWGIYTLHKSMGLVILFLVLFFAIWRLFNPKPVWPLHMKSWERVLARWVHAGLYIGFILMPLTGWLMATASGKAPNFFWLFKAPMPGIVLNKSLAAVASECHEVLAWLLSVLLVVHILGALKHHFIYKDNIMRRMCPQAGSTIKRP